MDCWSNASDSSLSEVFKCFVCTGQVQDAHLCPHCSRLFCYDCITKWLTEQIGECPSCRVVLDVDDLVTCRWVAEVTQHLDVLQANHNAANRNESGRDKCAQHSQTLSVYCLTCKRCICHECALWGGTHTGHTFKPMSEIYAQEVTRIRKEANQIRRRLINLITSAQDVQRAALSIRRAKEERLREMQDLIRKATAAMEQQLKTKITTLQGQQKSIAEESTHLERLLLQIDHQLKTCTQSELITKSNELSKMIYAVKQFQCYYNTPSTIALLQTPVTVPCNGVLSHSRDFS